MSTPSATEALPLAATARVIDPLDPYGAIDIHAYSYS